VVDFGLARIDDPNDSSASLNIEGVGTPQFVAPEVVRGRAATGQSDLYSLGLTMRVLLTGKSVFSGGTKAEMLRMQISHEFPDLRTIRPDIPEQLAAAITRATEKEPAKRFQTADQFARVLRLYTIPVHAGSDQRAGGAGSSSGALARGSPGWSKQSMVLGSIGVVAIAVALTGILWWWRDPAPHEVIAEIQTPSTETKNTTPPASTDARADKKPANPNPIPDASSPPAALKPKVPPTTPKPPATSPPVPAVAGVESKSSTVVDVTNQATLVELGQSGEEIVVVEGTISTARPSSTGKVMRINFRGVGESGFYAAYFPSENLFERMDRAFGGTNGSGLDAKHVRIRGKLAIFQDRPQIVVKNPDQIEILKD